MDKKEKNLFYLHELSDYKVADGYVDVRGFNVIDAAGKSVGKVDGMMANKAAERVVYLDVEVNDELIKDGHETYAKSAGSGVHEFLNEDGENHLIVPIGMVTIDEDNENVHSTEINYSTFAQTKRYKKDVGFDRSYELIVLPHYIPEYTVDTDNNSDQHFYDRGVFRSRV